MKLKPVADKVVLKKLNLEEKTESGILISTSEQTVTQVFEVVDVGDGNLANGTKVEMTVNPGDKVILNRYTNTPVKIEGNEYYVVFISDIIAIISD